MDSTRTIKKATLSRVRLLTHIDCCTLNLGTLFIFTCVCFFVGYFAVFRLSETLFFEVVSHRGFNLVQAGDLAVILSDRLCLSAAVLMLLLFSFFILFECAAVIIACHASLRGQKMTVSALFRLSFMKGLKLFLPANWPFFLHGLLLFPVFNIGLVYKAVSQWHVSALLAPNLDLPFGTFLACTGLGLLCAVMIGTWFVFAFHFFVLNGETYLTSAKRSVMMVRGQFVQTAFYLIVAVVAPYLFLALMLVPVGILFNGLFGMEMVNTVFERVAHIDFNAFFTDAQNRLSVLSVVFAALMSTVTTTALSLVNAPVFTMTIDAVFYRSGAEKYLNLAKALPEKSSLSRNKELSNGGYYTIVGLMLAVFVSYQAYALLNLMFWGSTNTVGRLMIAAHRGDTAKAPENTKSAIMNAIAAGADYVEIDVVETKDRELVLCHDVNLKRVCGIDQDIGTMTYQELKTLDIGSHYNRAFTKERFLTLDEAMTLCDGKIKMNIELKRSKHDDHMEEKAVDVFHNHFFYQKGFISSLDKNLLNRVKTLNPMITTCLDTFVPSDKIELCSADIYSVKAEYLTDDLLNTLEKTGKKCWAWTVNDEQSMTKLIDKGIAGIVSDHPRRALSLAKTRQVSDADFVKRSYLYSFFHIY